MGFIAKSIGIAVMVIGALYGIWYVFRTYSLLTIGTFVFIVVSIFLISGIGITLYMKVNDK